MTDKTYEWDDRPYTGVARQKTTVSYPPANPKPEPTPVSKPTHPSPKPSNPKDVAAVTRVPLNNIPLPALTALSLAMLEGELKYGRTNYRASGVQASVYLSALDRHVKRWIEGEERDPITKVKHLGNAMACLAILIDAQVNGVLYDDRRRDSPAAIQELSDEAATVAHLREIFRDQQPTHYLHGDRTAGGPSAAGG